jgi:ubiquinone/menaquinone biosynthesis C-methylase UbiE
MKMTPDEIYRRRKEFFNDHAPRWRDMWYKDHSTGCYDKHAKDFERLFSLITLKPGDHVLDVGCGTGILVPFILDRITETGILYELDYAEKMIEINRELHRNDNIRFILADAEEVPLDEASCDAIICFSCFPHLHEKEKSVATLGRILKQDGLFVVSHFESSEGIKKHHESCHAVMHDHLPDRDSMRKMLQAAGLAIHISMDEPGFYCINATKLPQLPGRLADVDRQI